MCPVPSTPIVPWDKWWKAYGWELWSWVEQHIEENMSRNECEPEKIVNILGDV